MASKVFKLTSAASTNLQPVAPMERVSLTGYEIVNTSAAAEFVKLYWGAPGSFSSSGDKPTVGTDVPNITIQIPTVAAVRQSYSSPVTGTGMLYMATTTGAADGNSTAVAAGDLVISLFWE